MPSLAQPARRFKRGCGNVLNARCRRETGANARRYPSLPIPQDQVRSESEEIRSTPWRDGSVRVVVPGRHQRWHWWLHDVFNVMKYNLVQLRFSRKCPGSISNLFDGPPQIVRARPQFKMSTAVGARLGVHCVGYCNATCISRQGFSMTDALMSFTLNKAFCRRSHGGRVRCAYGRGSRSALFQTLRVNACG